MAFLAVANPYAKSGEYHNRRAEYQGGSDSPRPQPPTMHTEQRHELGRLRWSFMIIKPLVLASRAFLAIAVTALSSSPFIHVEQDSQAAPLQHSGAGGARKS